MSVEELLRKEQKVQKVSNGIEDATALPSKKPVQSTNSKVVEFTSKLSDKIFYIGGKGVKPGQFLNPGSIAISKNRYT